MRKFFALSMVALLALTFAIAALGCGKTEEAPPAATEEAAPMADTSAMAMDSTAAQMTDTTQASH